MQRTTLRTIIGKPSTEQTVRLPNGIRRVKARPLSENETILCSFVKGDVENGIGTTATIDQPYDSGSLVLNSGPLFILSDQSGVVVSVDVQHTSPDTSDPGK